MAEPQLGFFPTPPDPGETADAGFSGDSKRLYVGAHDAGEEG